MIRKIAVVAAMLTAWTAIPAGAQERERTVPTRAFETFEYESETVDGFWAEAGALYEHTSSRDVLVNGKANQLDVDVHTGFARFAAGGSKWEANLLIPYHDLQAELKKSVGADPDGNGVGDILVGGKLIPIRSDFLDLGVGGNVLLPSGDKDKGLGTGSLGGTGFVTGALHLAIADLRGHVGGQFFTGPKHDVLAAGDFLRNTVASDRIVYGFDIIAPLCKYAALRNEFSGSDLYSVNGSPKVMTYLPGIDLRLPIGNLDAVLRLTGAYGITADAPNYGFGGSIVIGSQTTRAPISKTGGVVVE